MNNARFYHQSFSESTFHHTQHQMREELLSQRMEPEEMQKQTVDKSNSRYVSRKLDRYRPIYILEIFHHFIYLHENIVKTFL